MGGERYPGNRRWSAGFDRRPPEVVGVGDTGLDLRLVVPRLVARPGIVGRARRAVPDGPWLARAGADGHTFVMPRRRGKPVRPPANKTSLHLRIDFGAERSIGPGKIRLLELINETGSISAAGRALAMSYRQAWLLIDELNRMFKAPVVVGQTGGGGGGGAVVTPIGNDVVRLYRDMEQRAYGASTGTLRSLTRLLGDGPTTDD